MDDNKHFSQIMFGGLKILIKELNYLNTLRKMLAQLGL